MRQQRWVGQRRRWLNYPRDIDADDFGRGHWTNDGDAAAHADGAVRSESLAVLQEESRPELLGRIMERSRRASKTIREGLLVLILGALTIGALVEMAAQTPEQPKDDGTIKVLRLREMNGDEYKRRGLDVIGRGYMVRFRIEAPADHGIYVYSPDGRIPFCYELERTGTVVRWLLGIGAGDVYHSPGFDRTEKENGKGWMYLPAEAAFEWENPAWPTVPGTENAMSIFVRRTIDHPATEILSPWFSTAQVN